MRQISDHTIEMLAFRDPSLKPTAERYNICWLLLDDALYELDLAIKRIGLRRDSEDDPEIRYLRANIDLLEQERDISHRILLDALDLEYLQFGSP